LAIDLASQKARALRWLLPEKLSLDSAACGDLPPGRNRLPEKVTCYLPSSSCDLGVDLFLLRHFLKHSRDQTPGGDFGRFFNGLEMVVAKNEAGGPAVGSKVERRLDGIPGN